MADPLLLADMSGMNARFRLEEAIRCGDANAVKRFFSAVPGLSEAPSKQPQGCLGGEVHYGKRATQVWQPSFFV